MHRFKLVCLQMTSTALLLWMGCVPETVAEEKAKPIGKNSLGMTLVRVPSGEYLRGFDNADRGEHRFKLAHRYSNPQIFKYEQPAHRVAITKPFDIATTEVTVGQFRAFVEATGYVTDAERNGGALGCFPEEENYVDRFHRSPEITWTSPGFAQTDAHPVVCVSHNDAVKFCEWLSRKENATYRLPSEGEWEYACRAGRSTWYSWGEDPNDAYSHANVADGALEAALPKTTSYQRAVRLGADEGDDVVYTAKTGRYRANDWGLHDMHGNVWEWCADRWQADRYKQLLKDVPRQKRSSTVVRDPLFEQKTDQHAYGDWRVMRGGSWMTAPAAVRCSIRTFAEAADASVYTGFRVVREVK